jgi:L-ascorbate metabolism protein UlaG (beta-lactamase superfamily)
MEVKWLGHSCFLLTAGDGTKLLMDPFKADSHLSYKQVNEAADIVTVSHDHFDHNYTAALPGNPEVVKGAIENVIKGIELKGVSVFHDETGGKQRGSNTVFCAVIDDINVCHLGDLGHRLSAAELGAVGKVDVLLVPVGGVFTIDVETANAVCQDIKPRIAIPMHYKTDRCQFLQWSAEDFARGKKTVKRLSGSEIEITKNSRPAEFEVVVLKYPG